MSAGLTDLLAALVACDSTNPCLVPGGAGESALAALVAERLTAAGLETEVWPAAPGRDGVLGILPGAGGGPRLLLLSHLDVVGSAPSGFRPTVAGDRMHGRGTSDMKGGLAATIEVARRLAARPAPLRGDVLVAGVIDEEWRSAGALDLIARLADRRPDAAILPEATGLDLVVEHGGFAWWEILSTGAEAAGDDPDRGVDAIALLGPVLTGIVALDDELARRPRAPYGRPSIHAATIDGGSVLSAYPARCRVGIERCTVPGETMDGARAELEGVLRQARASEPRVEPALRAVVEREAVRLSRDEPIVGCVGTAATARLGRPALVRGDMGWMDSGILVEAGIPCLAFGPAGDGEHTADEWVDLTTVAACADVLEHAAIAFCS